MVISLYDYVNEMGYCRNYFRNIVDTDAKELHRKTLENFNIPQVDTDGYYLYSNDELEECPILFRRSTNRGRTKYATLDEYAKVHLVSSVIKNVFLDETTEDNRLKGNSAVYIYYYHAMYNAYDKAAADSLTESVVFYISNTIKTMIDKELTLYRPHVELISEFIDIMRIRLGMERTVDRARNINLRIS